MRTMRMRSKKQERIWNKVQDRSTPIIRKLLDRLQEARPDMFPLKLTSDPQDKGRMMCSKPLRWPGYGYVGVYALSKEWIQKEIRRVAAERRKEFKVETALCIGAGI